MNKELFKAYEPHLYEDDIYKKWEASGYFNPDNLKVPEKAKNYSIVMPPPNVTGTLHMGHAVMLALEDILIRYHRLKGERALWVPGTDHAAIATQTKVEKIIKEEGTDRHKMGREKFLERVGQFAHESHDTIVNQVKKIGSSCDWSREAYTLDETRTKAVRSVFKMMYDDGLIYRGKRIVNWCPRCASTLADDEVEYKEVKGKLYWIKYGPFILATTRPETKLGDTAVAVYPGDERYAHMVGKKYMIPGVLGEFEIIVVADKAVDPKFGSGAIKVTPAHDFADSEIAQRHKVPMKQIINEEGKMMDNCGKYAGLTTKEARIAIVADMEKMGLIDHIDDGYVHNIAVCYRCETQIEPIPSLQWFINVNKKILRYGKTIKELSIEAVKTGVFGKDKIKIIPERFEKNYYNWMENLRDWCISRQIWFGHRIPVWFKKVEKPMEIKYFVHGTTIDNEQKKSSGHYDAELSALGVEQSKKLKELIKDEKFDVVFCSDLKRAVDSSELAFGDRKIKIIKDKRLRECDYGDMTRADSEKVEAMEKEVINKPFPNGESLKDVEKRIFDFLEDLMKNYQGKKVAIVAHKYPQLSLEVVINGKTWEQALDEDWRKKNAWQPGWNYKLTELKYVGVKEPEEKINFVFLHGFYRTKDVKDPLNWLNQKLANINNFWSILPNPDKPNFKEQEEYVLNKAVITQDTVIVTHSLGGVLAMKLIEEKDLKIKKLVLIAPPLRPHSEELKDYNQGNKFDFARIKNNVKEIIIFQPSQDRVVPPGETAELVKELNAKVIKVENAASHFNSDECQEILDELRKDTWQQDEDTLDTWFSSGLWTFSTLAKSPQDIRIEDGKLTIGKIPQTLFANDDFNPPAPLAKGGNDDDFKKFHPTNVLETGYDILFFWVARMIIMTTYALGDIPFKDVYLHGLVLDEKGKKMSKSKGNTIDPLEMIKKYGTDATRLSLVMGTSPGADMKLWEEKIAGYRNFVNKLWNIARYIVSNFQFSPAAGQAIFNFQTISNFQFNNETLSLSDSWILRKMDDLITDVTNDLDSYKFAQAGERLRAFTWDYFADWYLEVSKFEKGGEKENILPYILTNLLKLWHPFMPFVTEKIWDELFADKLLMIESWPSVGAGLASAQGGRKGRPYEVGGFELIKNIIIAIRNARSGNKVEPAKKIKAIIYAGDKFDLILSQETLIKSLRTGLDELEIKVKGEKIGSAIYITVDGVEIYLLGAVDSEKEKARLEKEVANLQKLIKALEMKLGNSEFTAKAPEQIVAKEKEKLEKYKSDFNRLSEQVKKL